MYNRWSTTIIKKQQHTTINSTYAAGMFMLVNKNGYFIWGGRTATGVNGESLVC